MRKWKALAILFTLISIGAVKETFRIFTSQAADIAPNRTGLIIMSVCMTLVFVFFAARFWRKAAEKKIV